MAKTIKELQERVQQLVDELPEMIPEHRRVILSTAPAGCIHSSFHLLLVSVPCSLDDPTEAADWKELEEELGLEVLAHETYVAIGG